MTMKEIAKKIIASINPGKEDISDIGSGTIKGALRDLKDGIVDPAVATEEGFIADAKKTGDVFAVLNDKFNHLKTSQSIALANKSIPTGTTDTLVDLFTVPESGFYFLNFYAQWQGSSAGGMRNARITVSVGGSLVHAGTTESLPIHHVLLDTVYLEKGTAVQMALRQTAGISLVAYYGGRYSYIPL